jgi:hypothetical protein
MLYESEGPPSVEITFGGRLRIEGDGINESLFESMGQGRCVGPLTAIGTVAGLNGETIEKFWCRGDILRRITQDGKSWWDVKRLCEVRT